MQNDLEVKGATSNFNNRYIVYRYIIYNFKIDNRSMEISDVKAIESNKISVELRSSIEPCSCDDAVPLQHFIYKLIKI